MLYSAYIWDFDGTLFDSYPHIAASFEKTLKRHGIPFDHETVLERLTVNFKCARDEYRLTNEQYREFLGYTWAVHPSVALFSGAAAVLRAICESGGRNFLYTHRERSARTYLRLFGIEKYFSGYVDDTMNFPLKPAPNAVEFLCSQYGLDKAKTVMVGDREIDVLSGVNAGIEGCLFLSHPVREKTTAAKHTVYSLRELADVCGIPFADTDILSEDAAASLQKQAETAAEELCRAAGLTAGQTVVIGCSSSEITGERIGSSSSPDAAKAVFDGLSRVFGARGIHMAAQCCEHLNRALIIDRAAWHGEEIVNAVPMPKAGGAFAYTAYSRFADPIAIAEIRADAGLDIGGTMIGMHLKKVAVPLRLEQKSIGAASLAAARVRPPFVGGERAVYDAELL